MPRVLDTITLSREDFLRLREGLPAITREHLFNRYAISETTWNKLREGRPIRRSTLDRILRRYDTWKAQAQAQAQAQTSAASGAASIRQAARHI